jgi:glycosyltransferase involved in cell wall biosynthesis
MNKKAALVTNKPLGFSGGVERFNFYLDRLLKSRGYQVDIFHTENVPPPRTPGNSFAINRITYAVSSYVRTCKRDYAIIVSNGGFGWGIGRPQAGQRFYNVYHGTAAGLKNATLQFLDFKTYVITKYLSDGLVERLSGLWKKRIAVSKSTRRELKHEYWLEATVVDNGVDMAHFMKLPDKNGLRKKYAIPENKQIGLFCGRADIYMKGIDKLIEIVNRLQDVYWLLAIGGDSSAVAQSLRAANYRIIEDVPYEGMPEIYNVADFALYLSRYEGNAYYLLEALACQVPVIATPAGAAQEIYQDEILQKLFLPLGTDHRDLIEDVVQRCELCGNREIADRMGERGRAIIEKKYSLPVWERSMAAALALD